MQLHVHRGNGNVTAYHYIALKGILGGGGGGGQ